MNNLFYIILKKDFKDNLLSNKAWFTISFFLLCLIIFPLAFGSSQYLELNVSISAIWVSTLFANLIALDHMYKEDYNDGTLLYYIVNKVPLVIVVYAKCISHWLFSGLPIILIAPLCSYIFSGYSENNLNLFGAVSKEVVIDMINGLRKNTNSDILLAISGIAGPGGGTINKPEGLVWVSYALKNKVLKTSKLEFGPIGRDLVREKSTKQSLRFLLSLFGD